MARRNKSPKRKKKNQGVLSSVIGSAAGSSLGTYAIQEADKATRTITHMRTRNKRRNSVASAEREYEAFHGRAPEVDTVITTEMHEHANLPAIGELCWIVVRFEVDNEEVDVTLEDFEGALLCMNEQRAQRPQLYIEGGDQRVDLRQFDIGPPLHENETLGRLVCVAYYTTKDHLGEEDGGEAEYVHVIEPPLDEDEFYEWGLDEMGMDWDDVEEETEGAVGPDVIYDTRNKLLLLSGGSYSLPDEGIDH
jgi:hypothetical protein